jgi:hypothetical protein
MSAKKRSKKHEDTNFIFTKPIMPMPGDSRVHYEATMIGQKLFSSYYEGGHDIDVRKITNVIIDYCDPQKYLDQRCTREYIDFVTQMARRALPIRNPKNPFTKELVAQALAVQIYELWRKHTPEDFIDALRSRGQNRVRFTEQIRFTINCPREIADLIVWSVYHF